MNPRRFPLFRFVLAIAGGALLAPLVWFSQLFQPSAYSAQSLGDNLMTIELLAFIALLFVVLALVYAVIRANFVLSTQVPSEIVQTLIRAAVETALSAAQRYAEETPSKVDDELIAAIRAEIAKVLGTAAAVQIAQSAPPAPQFYAPEEETPG
jgi:hypothetical protein